MRHRFLLFLLAAWTVMAATLPAQAAGPVFPPGSRIGLEPAGNLSMSRRFRGFEDIDRSVTVAIFDLPAAAYDQLSRSAFADPADVANLKRETFAFAGGIGVLVSGTTEVSGTKVHRWFLIASAAPGEAQDLSTLVRVDVPDAAASAYDDASVRKMLATVAFRVVPTEELLGLLPFKLTDLAGFRVMRVVPDGVIVIDGESDDMAKQPYAIVSVGRGAPDNVDDRLRFARNLLGTAPLNELKIGGAEPMRIGGWPGVEIRGEASGLKGEPVKLVQWVRFGSVNGAFLRVVAVAGKDRWDDAFTRFRALRDGVDLR